MQHKLLLLLAAGLLATTGVNAQCTNLVTNPDATSGTTGWSIVTAGDAGVIATTDNTVDCFAFSQGSDSLSQTIDLGTSTDLTAQPNITFSAQIKTSSNAICITAPYNITVTVLDGSSNVLATWTTGDQNAASQTNWEIIQHSFVSYGGTPRYVNIVVAGGDCDMAFAANNGIEITNFSLTTLIPAATNGTATGVQNPHTTLSYDDAGTCTETGVVLTTGAHDLGSTTVVSMVDNTVQTFNSQPYLQRHYEIEPTTNDSAVVTLYVDQADFDAYNLARGSFPQLPTTTSTSDPDLANLSITAFHGVPSGGYAPSNYSGARQLIPNSAITSVYNTAASRWEFSFTINNFSGFFFSTGSTPLNISMGDLNLNTHNGRHLLNWNTYTEAANDYFEIERSSDGKSFTTIGKTLCSGKPGAYAYTDNATPAGTSYYRLKLINGRDGGTTYSNIVSGKVNDAAISLVTVHPNPASGTLHVTLSNGDTEGSLSLADAAGRELKQVNVSGTSAQMDLRGIPAGLYFLNYRQGGQSQTIKVTVE